MPTAQQFEDLHVCQDARDLVRQMYTFTNQRAFRRDFSLRDQITRAVTSTLANIAEGFERRTRKEFVQFLSIAKGSNGELRSHLYVALDQDYLNEKSFQELRTSCMALSRWLAKFITYPKRYPRNSRIRANESH